MIRQGKRAKEAGHKGHTRNEGRTEVAAGRRGRQLCGRSAAI
jgi:hypothetical protein